MSFRKPFRAEPVVLGEYARNQDRRYRRKRMLRLVASTALLGAAVFAIGMLVTNWSSLMSSMPRYYASCADARRAGVAPMYRGEPGYRAKLDEDGDGKACEGSNRS